MRNFIREKKIYCGEDYREIDIVPYSLTQMEVARKSKRSKKEKISEPKQKNLNDKNARRFFIQKVNANFGKNDYHISCTYKDKFLPESHEAADKIALNFIRRINYLRKKQGLKPAKFMMVTEVNSRKGERIVRIHHHIIIEGGMPRDSIEELWRAHRKKGQKQGDAFGHINVDRLKPDDDGLAGLATYLMKNPNGKRRWRSSQNLINPESRNNDSKYKRRQIEKIAKQPFDPEFWKKIYPGWHISSEEYGYNAVYNEQTGWHIYLRLRRDSS